LTDILISEIFSVNKLDIFSNHMIIKDNKKLSTDLLLYNSNNKLYIK